MTATLAARDRGMLIIVEQAAQCLTASEVLEVDDVGGASGRLLGLSLGTEDPAARSRSPRTSPTALQRSAGKR